MDRPWKAPLAQKLIRPSSCTLRISTPGTWLRHAVQRLHASSCAGVFIVEQATMRKATIVDVGVPMNAHRVVTQSPDPLVPARSVQDEVLPFHIAEDAQGLHQGSGVRVNRLGSDHL